MIVEIATKTITTRIITLTITKISKTKTTITIKIFFCNANDLGIFVWPDE